MAGPDIRREAVRNRLLRRADWRFLLPNPGPARSVCFATGRLAEAAALISGSLADTPLTTEGECDLAIAVNPGRTTLAAAYAALRPGGACYTEWYSPLAGGAVGVRRRLAAAGFDDVACYWPWPWPLLSGAQVWLPLEAPGALRHFLRDRPGTRGVILRLARAARRAAWLLSLRLRLALPVCAVARKTAPPTRPQPSSGNAARAAAVQSARASGMDADLADTLQANWGAWGFGPAPDHFSWLMLTGGYRSTNKVVGLVFAGSASTPRLVIKLPRVPESVPALMREAAVLRAVQGLRPGGMPGVPRLLFCREHDGFPAVGETALSGMPLFTRLRRDTYRALALAATDWLVLLAGRREPRPRAVWWDRLVEPVLADFSASFGAVVDPGLLREGRDILATVDALPLVCEQRDFSPWNALIARGGELAVLDWESAELQGLPALDLVYFLTYLAFFLDGAVKDGVVDTGRCRASYRASLDSSTLTGSVRRECLTRYASGVGLQPTALRPLSLLVWLLHARSEYGRAVADAGGQPGLTALRGSLFVGLWQEEMSYAARVGHGEV